MVQQGSRALLTIMITVINWHNSTSLLSMCQEDFYRWKIKSFHGLPRGIAIAWIAIWSGSRFLLDSLIDLGHREPGRILHSGNTRGLLFTAVVLGGCEAEIQCVIMRRT
jgi:hypothetical protein